MWGKCCHKARLSGGYNTWEKKQRDDEIRADNVRQMWVSRKASTGEVKQVLFKKRMGHKSRLSSVSGQASKRLKVDYQASQGRLSSVSGQILFSGISG
ncbi:hypothetical protein COLO4_24466 [Corchorus olitorius]|uniref:Uncharacterized protein n=1 Tax=Corchorus olitorius TaxID=93759 RepID=A0A1R3I9R2_9ROSI|nr:hypothetical protein COLO4_24466 [Corchorus olitorius]